MKTLFKGAFITALLAFGSFANASIINFNDYAISGYATQARSGSSTVEDGGFTLSLAGNLWVDIFYNSVLTSDSILNFTFMIFITYQIYHDPTKFTIGFT